MRLLRSIVACSLLLSTSLSLGADLQQGGGELTVLVNHALVSNPEIRANEARWKMFTSKVVQAGALDDPMLMLRMQSFLLREPFNSRRDPMSQKVVGISQQLPFWGKRALKEELALREAESYQWQLEERKLELARMVKETWYQLYLTDREQEVVAKNIRIMDDFILLAETRYATGQGSQQDVFKAQVERSRMLDMQISIEQRRKSLAAALNSLVYRPLDTTIPVMPDVIISPVSLSARELHERAVERRPLLKSYRSLIAKSDVGRRLAEREFYPDINISFEYMQRDRIDEMEAGYDMYSLGLTFNLPLQRQRRHAMLREADSETSMAQSELDSLINGIDAGIADNLAHLERRQRLSELYRTGIIPQAEQSLESAAIGYRVGKVDFLTLLENRLTLFTYERDYYESLAEHGMKRAQLEALVGGSLE